MSEQTLESLTCASTTTPSCLPQDHRYGTACLVACLTFAEAVPDVVVFLFLFVCIPAVCCSLRLCSLGQGDTMLGVPGEELENVFSARAFVNWYNGHPEFVHLSPNLDVEHVVVIGNGNVAIDCARILVKSVEELTATDIADQN